MRSEITIVNKLGLHARAAVKLVELASTFNSKITLARGAKSVNGKSIMGVMMLAASKGTVVEVIAEGDDEALALEKIKGLVLQRFGEGE